MASLRDLPGVAEKFLALFSAQLVEHGVELPERRYRTPSSMVVWDGEQFTVSLMGVDQGQPGGAIQTSVVPQAITFYAGIALNLIRRVSVVNVESFVGPEVPTPEEMDTDGVALLTDASALIAAASQIHQDYSITNPGEGFVIGPLTPVGPEGGLAGNRLLVSVSVD